MINTLNVATQGHLPNLTSLSLATLGWLGYELDVFIEDNEFVWSLDARGENWNLVHKNENWFLNKQDIEWTISMQDLEWHTAIQNIKWTIPEKESD
jgi:hypothetical protein